MTTKILALTDALGNLVRFELLPGHRFDTVGIEPLIEGVDFGGLIADKAFDSDAIMADLNARCQDCHLSASKTRKTTAARSRPLQMAPSHRKLLLQAQGVQAHCHESRQNRPKLLRNDLSRSCRHQFTMNPHKP
jgi:hypothetical protein